MFEDPNRRQQPSDEQQYYGQPPQYGQPQYGQPPPQYGQQQQYYGQPPQYGQPQYGQPQIDYVSVGPRFLAYLIDGLIIGAVSGLLFFPFRDAPGAWGGSIGLLSILYFIVMEATQGATLGKMALGLRVVKADGSPISWRESIIRNLLRIVDGLFAYLVGAILIWNSPLRQRLGDRAAGTVVVRSRR